MEYSLGFYLRTLTKDERDYYSEEEWPAVYYLKCVDEGNWGPKMRQAVDDLIARHPELEQDQPTPSSTALADCPRAKHVPPRLRQQQQQGEAALQTSAAVARTRPHRGLAGSSASPAPLGGRREGQEARPWSEGSSGGGSLEARVAALETEHAALRATWRRHVEALVATGARMQESDLKTVLLGTEAAPGAPPAPVPRYSHSSGQSSGQAEDKDQEKGGGGPSESGHRGKQHLDAAADGGVDDDNVQQQQGAAASRKERNKRKNLHRREKRLRDRAGVRTT